MGGKNTQQVQVDVVPVHNPFNALLDDVAEVCGDDEENEVAGDRIRIEDSFEE